MSDLVRRLRDLSAAKHDDLSVGDEAATRIEELEGILREVDDLIKYQYSGSREAMSYLHYIAKRVLAAFGS